MSCTFAPAFSFSSVAFNAIHSISLSIYADNLDALTALSVSFMSVSLPLSPALSPRLCLCFLASVRVATSPCTPYPFTVACGAHAAHDDDDVQIAHAAAAAAETATTNSTPRPLAGIRLRAGTLPLPHYLPPPSLSSHSSVWSAFWLLALGFGASWASQLTLQLQYAARIDFTFDANEN